uniref:phosphoinositide phospholipase C n=1 Tax=Pithovirus LCPAC001 TaxID=2506585 RepID=A0A481Z1H5_9VIRU|nr:MAG: phosphatidylinositol-specific phospholipase C [Pithovirus LCPAC001]
MESNDKIIIEFIKIVWPTKTSQKLNLKQVHTLFFNSNYRADLDELKSKFTQADLNGDGFLDFNEIMIFIRKMRFRPEIKCLFELITDNLISEQVLYHFLTGKQKNIITLNQCRNIIKNYYFKSLSLGINAGTEQLMSHYQFDQLMTGSLNTIGNINHKTDMSHSLSHYYISSSHNTYLEGDQLIGKSSTNQYEHVLREGCKCVELDCWDDTKNKVPIIYHGYTLTSKVTFVDVIRVINKYAFFKSPYPLILSLENHCTYKYQNKMAKILIKTFGDKLLKPTANWQKGIPRAAQFAVNKIKVLPSPDQLKNKIIIKCKITQKTDSKFAKLIYFDTVKKVDAELTNMISYGEDIIGNAQTNKIKSIKKYTTTNLVRIYPKGTRVDSSNYNPIKSWSYGCQVVALNWQNNKVEQWINRSMFRSNKEIGYRLKPKHLISNSNIPSGISILNIKLLSGRFLPKETEKDVISPYIKITVIGHKSDYNVQKSTVVVDNGLFPLWNFEFSFKMIHSYMNFVLFELYNNKTMLAYYVVKMDDIRIGYRNIPLIVVKSIPYPIKPTLFCQVEKKCI